MYKRQLLASLLLTSLAGIAPAAWSAEAIVIKFSHVVAPDTPKGRAADKFKELANTYTSGKAKVEVYPNSQLYKDKEELEALQLGAVHMLAPSLAKFGPLGAKEFEVFDFPCIFPNYTGLHKVTPVSYTHLDVYKRQAQHGEHDQIFPVLLEMLIIHPAAYPKIGQKNAVIRPRRADQLGHDLLTARRADIDRQRALALVQARPKQALVVVGHRPAVIVQAPSDAVEANHFRAHLRQGHPGQRRCDKRGAFNNPQSF